MDVPQLKLLAGLVRALLEQHNVPVGHSQSLDLIAALAGLRNWPEVNAFPDRVAACNLDQGSSSRLAYRLKSKHGVELTGIVDDDGDLKLRHPFAGTPPAPLMIASDAPLDVVPPSVLPDLRLALSRRSTGILTFGCSVLVEHRAIDLIAAMLPLTESVGPAARIKPRNHGTPAKDMMVPDAVKVLPFLPRCRERLRPRLSPDDR
jgi:hypothetical protein